MKLKKIKKKTRVRIKNKNEYFLLMKLLEEAGYVWVRGENPTYFNDRNDYTDAEVVELLENKKIYIDSSGIHGNEKPLRKVVKFEVGDTVRIREDLEEMNGKEGTVITTRMIEHAGETVKIRNVHMTWKKRLYILDFETYRWLWLKKWLVPVASRRKEN